MLCYLIRAFFTIADCLVPMLKVSHEVQVSGELIKAFKDWFDSEDVVVRIGLPSQSARLRLYKFLLSSFGHRSAGLFVIQ
jgi:hypothetical protein